MTDTYAREDSLPLDVEYRIHRRCAAFEAAHQAQMWPQMEDFLRDCSDSGHGPLLEELLLLEWHYRGRSGQAVDTQAYLARFQDEGPRVRRALERFQRLNEAAGSPQTGTNAPFHDTSARFAARTAKLPQPNPSEPNEGELNEDSVPSGETRVFGDYELLDLVGRGGMGVVYRARQVSADRIVALKLIRPERLSWLDPGVAEWSLERFQTEALAAAKLNHDHVVPVYDVGISDGSPYYTMPYLEGGSLAEIARDAPIDPRLAAQYVEGVARGVHEAHQEGILHRDLKPANVLLDRRSGRAMVTDFGLAKLGGDSQLTASGDVLGSPAYMAPEQASNTAEADVAADVFGMGAILYFLLTSRPPAQGSTPAETLRQVVEDDPVAPRLLNRSLDRDLDTITMKCLEKDTTRRYASAEDLAADLERYQSGVPIQARPASVAHKVWRWCRRQPTTAVLIGSTVLLLLAIAIAGPVVALRQAALKRDAQRLFVEGMENARRKGRWTDILATLEAEERRGIHDPVQLQIQKILTLRAMGNVRESRKQIERLAKRNDFGRFDATVNLLVGDDLLAQGNQTEGLRRVQDAVDRGLEPADLAYAKALLAPDTLSAVTQLERAVALNPVHQQANNQLAFTLLLLGRADELTIRAEAMLLIYPRDPTFPMTLAIAEAIQGDLDAASARIERAAKTLPPEHVESIKRLCVVVAELAESMTKFGSPNANTKVQELTQELQKLQTNSNGTTTDGWVLRVPPAIPRAYKSVYEAFVSPATRDSASLAVLAEQHPEALMFYIAALAHTKRDPNKAHDLYVKASEAPALIPKVRRFALYGAARSEHMLAERKQGGSHERACEFFQRFHALGVVADDELEHCFESADAAGDLDFTRRVVDDGLSRGPDSVKWLLRSSDVAFKCRQYLRAHRDARRVLQQDPQSQRADQLANAAATALRADLDPTVD